MLVLSVLQHNRPQLADEIHCVIAQVVEKALKVRLGRELTRRETKALAPLLDAPNRPEPLLQMRPIASLIRQLFSGRGR